jgi:hypothetical protein
MTGATPAGFPTPQVAGKALPGWLVIDRDATLVTARPGKQGAAPAWKKGYGFHPLGAWLASTGSSPRPSPPTWPPGRGSPACTTRKD